MAERHTADTKNIPYGEKERIDFLLSCLSEMDKSVQRIENEKRFGIRGFFSRFNLAKSRRRTNHGSLLNIKQRMPDLKAFIVSAEEALHKNF